MDRDTTLRVKQGTKERLTSLDFVRKQSFDEIINTLIDSLNYIPKDKIIEIRRKRAEILKEKLRRMS